MYKFINVKAIFCLSHCRIHLPDTETFCKITEFFSGFLQILVSPMWIKIDYQFENCLSHCLLPQCKLLTSSHADMTLHNKL